MARQIQNLQQFYEAIRRGNYVVLDTETTGIQRGEIVQIALVDASGQTLLDTLVKPVGRIPYETTRIHGITEAMVADAPGWADVSPQVETLLRERDVIVYNAVFDRKMMHFSAQAAGLPKTDWKTFSQWWCAMEAFAEAHNRLFPSRGRPAYHKLSQAARYYRIPLVNAHNALGDAQMTLALVQAMLRNAG